MPFVLTEASEITCPHQGRIKFTSNPAIKLKVSLIAGFEVKGKRVIVADDVKKIDGCTTTLKPSATPPEKPCSVVLPIISGSSSKLKVNGKAVLTTDLEANTDGVAAKPPPPYLLTNKEQQSKLTTI